MESSNEKRNQEFLTNKLLLVFTIVFLGIFVTMYLYKMAVSSITGYWLVDSIIQGAFYTSLVLTGICGIIFCFELKKPYKDPYKLITGKHGFFVFATTSICLFIAHKYSVAFKVNYIYIFLTIVAVQYFVLVSYTKDVYSIAVTNMVNITLLYLSSNSSRLMLYTLVSLGFLSLSFILTFILQKKDGSFKNYPVFKKTTNYKMLYLNMLLLSCITIANYFLLSIGFSVGALISGIYLVVVIFYNTLKLL